MYRMFCVTLLLSLTVLVGSVQAERILWFPFENDVVPNCGFGGTFDCPEYTSHEGTDFPCDNGTPIYASISGTVQMVNDVLGQTCTWSFGNYVQITGGNYRVIEAHMLIGSIALSNGEYVEAGQYLGLSSNSGYTLNAAGECMQGGGYHLHLQVEVWQNDSWVPVDPYVYDGGMWTNPLMYGGQNLTYQATYSSQTPTYPPGLDYYLVAPGQILPVSFTFNNTGTAYWTNDFNSPHYVELQSVTGPSSAEPWSDGLPSDLAYNWIDANGVGIATTTGQVDPGGQGLYSFQIQAPSAPGDYYLYTALYRPHSGEFISGTGPTLHIRVEPDIVFFDDFEDGDVSDWTVYNNGIWRVNNGWAIYENGSGGTEGYAVAGDPWWSNYSLELDFKRMRSDHASIWLRMQSDASGSATSNGYEIVFRSSDIVLLKYLGGEQWRQSYPFSSSIGVAYHLVISLDGDNIQLWVNGARKINKSDPGTALTQGNFALGGVFNAKVAFDNVIVRTIGNPLLPQTIELLPPDYSIETAESGTVNQGGTEVVRLLTDFVSRAWQIILNWPGSELNLKVYKPDGALYGEWQSATPPIVANFIPADTGTWSFEVTAIDVPNDNYPFALVAGSLALGSLSGIVADSLSTPLLGVPVDLYDNATNALLASEVSDSLGSFSFPNLVPGAYNVSITTPLGYQAAAEARLVNVTGGNDSTADFSLTALSIMPVQRSRGYWKRQVSHIIKNIEKGKSRPTDFSADDMMDFLGLTEDHFVQSRVNPIPIYDGQTAATRLDSLKLLKDLLFAKKQSGSGDTRKLRRGRAELMALILNVVAGKISQAEVISRDGINVSQAITYCWTLLASEINCTNREERDDESLGGGECYCRHKRAEKILRKINHGKAVKAGVIPADTDFIAYKGAGQSVLLKDFSVAQNYPNPFNPSTTISYSLPEATHVTLSVYNILGQPVATLIDEYQIVGQYSIVWVADKHASGVYFYRLTAGQAVEMKKMVLLK